MLNLNAEIVSAAAAVVSAIGGALATLAAFLSAASARHAQDAAAEAERRAALRQVGLTASEILVERRRVEARGIDAKQVYRSLSAFSGNTGGSREGLYLNAIDEKERTAAAHADYANIFASQSEKLRSASIEEIDRIQINLSNALTEIRALREDLEHEHTSIEAQCAVYREKVIHGTTRQ